MMKSANENNRDAVGPAVKDEDSGAVARALRILLSFSADRHTQSARAVAETTGIPLPSVYRYVAVLRDMGLLIRDEQSDYHLSAQFIGLGRAAEAGETLIEIADPVMRRLAAATGETVLLVRLVGDAAICVHRIESSHRLRISFEPGQGLPLDRGASARLLLASLTPDERRARLADLWRQDRRRATALEDQVVLAAERQWATSEEEIDPGIWAAAAAVCDARGITAVISVPSPLVRAPHEVQEQLLERVRTAADEVSWAVRHRSPRQAVAPSGPPLPKARCSATLV
jgi:DNA-binding IclR family transcriptional regulator